MCTEAYQSGNVVIAKNQVFTKANLVEFDKKKYNLYNSLGFCKDGFLRKHYFYEGKWWGSYILSLISDEYEKI